MTLGQDPEIGFEEFDELCRENLSMKDYKKTMVIRSLFDLFNLRSYWKEEPFDRYGNLNLNEMGEALVARSILPNFVYDYIDKYEILEERLSHFPKLLAMFYHHVIGKTSNFLKFYFQMERELRLVLSAFRAKMLERDIFKELQYEDANEDLIAQILAQKDAQVYQPPERYEEVGELLEKYFNKPVELQRALLSFRFNQIEERLGIELFSIDRILAYMVKLIMVEKWQGMDKEKGLKIVESVLRG